MRDVELAPEVAARVDALLETVDLEPLGRALADVLYDAWERRLAASEAHARECSLCSLNTPEDACPEGKRLEGLARMAGEGGAAS